MSKQGSLIAARESILLLYEKSFVVKRNSTHYFAFEVSITQQTQFVSFALLETNSFQSEITFKEQTWHRVTKRNGSVTAGKIDFKIQLGSLPNAICRICKICSSSMHPVIDFPIRGQSLKRRKMQPRRLETAIFISYQFLPSSTKKVSKLLYFPPS